MGETITHVRLVEPDDPDSALSEFSEWLTELGWPVDLLDRPTTVYRFGKGRLLHGEHDCSKNRGSGLTEYVVDLRTLPHSAVCECLGQQIRTDGSFISALYRIAFETHKALEDGWHGAIIFKRLLETEQDLRELAGRRDSCRHDDIAAAIERVRGDRQQLIDNRTEDIKDALASREQLVKLVVSAVLTYSSGLPERLSWLPGCVSSQLRTYKLERMFEGSDSEDLCDLFTRWASEDLSRVDRRQVPAGMPLSDEVWRTLVFEEMAGAHENIEQAVGAAIDRYVEYAIDRVARELADLITSMSDELLDDDAPKAVLVIGDVAALDADIVACDMTAVIRARYPYACADGAMLAVVPARFAGAVAHYARRAQSSHTALPDGFDIDRLDEYLRLWRACELDLEQFAAAAPALAEL